jgi:hypothetical protein
MARLKVSRDAALAWLHDRFDIQQLDVDEQVKGTLTETQPVDMARLSASIDLLDMEVRRQSPDAATAVRWWMALDTLRAQLRTPDKALVPAKLQKLREKIYASHSIHA